MRSTNSKRKRPKRLKNNKLSRSRSFNNLQKSSSRLQHPLSTKSIRRSLKLQTSTLLRRRMRTSRRKIPFKTRTLETFPRSTKTLNSSRVRRTISYSGTRGERQMPRRGPTVCKRPTRRRTTVSWRPKRRTIWRMPLQPTMRAQSCPRMSSWQSRRRRGKGRCRSLVSSHTLCLSRHSSTRSPLLTRVMDPCKELGRTPTSTPPKRETMSSVEQPETSQTKRRHPTMANYLPTLRTACRSTSSNSPITSSRSPLQEKRP